MDEFSSGKSWLLETSYKFFIICEVQEEERQALAAADTDAAKGAIATAEVSRKTIPTYLESRNPIFKSL
ncbi:Programmed cell death protein 7 [Cucumis melo var. makuwa]|uniref:Programmed cell death protein 7 n=1 Tax=Cucumis melo var. makuwa TaxID=1194695 RepID=A0A5D3DWL4_CUCMM|nr:Programmed cell death protein 7 [Cucumis melo var. makuwa]TYK27828.1 Programmed cell death protein 7 [Cucumis melo var. makuwa]